MHQPYRRTLRGATDAAEGIRGRSGEVVQSMAPPGEGEKTTRAGSRGRGRSQHKRRMFTGTHKIRRTSSFSVSMMAKVRANCFVPRPHTNTWCVFHPVTLVVSSRTTCHGALCEAQRYPKSDPNGSENLSQFFQSQLAYFVIW